VDDVEDDEGLQAAEAELPERVRAREGAELAIAEQQSLNRECLVWE
jgi:hypothetical protein